MLTIPQTHTSPIASIDAEKGFEVQSPKMTCEKFNTLNMTYYS